MASLVQPPGLMGVRRYRDLVAWQLADEFKRQIADLVRASPAAERDFKYRGQILESSRAVSKDIAEGFVRRSPLEFVRFLDYALGSLAEAEDRLIDGIELDYFQVDKCAGARVLAKRCTTACIRLKESQVHYAAEEKRRRHSHRRPRTSGT